MAAMAIQAAVALGKVACLAPNAQFVGAASESRRTTATVQSRRPVQDVTAVESLVGGGEGNRRQSRSVVVRAEAAGIEVSTAATTTTNSPDAVKAGGITEVDKDTFWPIMKSAGEKLVVLDMYTQWCGPCKLILPKIQALAATMDDVIFCKLDCNQDNKTLAKELGIKAVPTFKIFKAGELVTTITGAKYDSLVAAIETARKGQ